MSKVTIVVEIADQPRLREMVAMWLHAQVGQVIDVFHPMPIDMDEKVGELFIVDFVSAEVERG